MAIRDQMESKFSLLDFCHHTATSRSVLGRGEFFSRNILLTVPSILRFNDASAINSVDRCSHPQELYDLKMHRTGLDAQKRTKTEQNKIKQKNYRTTDVIDTVNAFVFPYVENVDTTVLVTLGDRVSVTQFHSLFALVKELSDHAFSR